MRSILSIFFIVLFVFFPQKKSQAQFIEKNSQVFTKNKIEIVAHESDSSALELKLACIDSIFSYCEISMLQLEKNLLYKMSDKIHLVVFEQLTEYEKFININKSENLLNHRKDYQTFFPLYIGQNFHSIQFQCRYATAYQFVHEYLYGLSYREKNDFSESSHIPGWLIEGFLQYFSGGINVSDFHKFEQYNKSGHFKNINFIPEVSQPVFGTVLWYLFEKEKGKGFNSAFWYLIKYANSFEGSFEYQFGIKFKQWLKQRIVEIENFKIKSKINGDINIPQKKLKLNYLYKLTLSLNSHEEYESYLLGGHFNHQKLILANPIGYHALLNEAGIGLYPKLVFNQMDIASKANPKAPGIWLLHRNQNQWNVGTFNDSQKLIITYKLNNYGNYKLLKDYADHLTVVSENLGISKIQKIDLNGKISDIYSTKSQINFYRYLKHNGRLIVSKSTTFKDRTHESVLIYIDSFNNESIIYSDSHKIGETQFIDIIEESPTHLSFIQNIENKQSLIHLYLINGKWTVKANDTKDMFYHQWNGVNEKEITEYYLNSDGVSINRYNLNEALYSQDTLKNKQYSFDTLNVAAETKPKSLDFDSSMGYFLSPYPIILKQKSQGLKLVTSNSVKSVTSFNQMFYSKSAGLRLSNEEIPMMYRSNLPLQETFNSIFTLFFQNEIYGNDNHQRFVFSGFSSIDRNRIGFQIAHKYLAHQYTISSNLSYRTRQFKGYQNQILRDNGTSLEVGISKKNKGFLTQIISKFQIQSDIHMNMDEFSARIENRHIPFGGLEFGIKTNSQDLLKRQSKFKFVTSAGLQLQMAQKLDTFKNLSQLEFQFQSEYSVNFFQFKSKFNAVYALNHQQILNYIGGSSGSLQQSQFSSDIINQINPERSLFLRNLGSLRGFLSGDRVGSSGFVCQNEIQLSPLNFFPSRVIESNFWKKLIFLGFLDFGTAFNGSTPSDISNPYNTIIYNQNTYSISVTANRNPYLFGIGYGVNFMVLGYNFRIERAFGYEENELKNRMYHFCIGKNF